MAEQPSHSFYARSRTPFTSRVVNLITTVQRSRLAQAVIFVYILNETPTLTKVHVEAADEIFLEETAWSETMKWFTLIKLFFGNYTVANISILRLILDEKVKIKVEFRAATLSTWGHESRFLSLFFFPFCILVAYVQSNILRHVTWNHWLR